MPAIMEMEVLSKTALFLLSFIFLGCVTQTEGQYDDFRCKCVCQSLSVLNITSTEAYHNRKLYIKNVEPPKCDCENVVLPQIDVFLHGHDKEFCPRCQCKYESRNTMTIKVVVIIIIWIISLLVVYMLFLMCLDPLLNKRQATYQEHTNEEVTLEEPPEVPVSTERRPSTNVLNRVGHQQYKWKRQVQEQRRNIYDRHTMLN